MNQGLWMRSLLAVCIAALLLFPLAGSVYYTQLFTKIMILSIFAMSLDLLVGYTGLVSLGHAAFFGLAGYVLALMSPQYEAANLLTTLPAALAASALAALAIGLLVLRTSGIYFIMVTLAFAQMLYYLFHDTKLGGGSDGIYINLKPALSIGDWVPFSLESKIAFYYFALALMLAVYALLRAVLRSTFGRALQGIKANEQRMRSLGFATFRYKLAAFVLAGTLAGLSGYLAAMQFGFVNPEILSWHQSGNVLMMVILGGMGSLAGPVLGAFAFTLLQDLFESLTRHWQLLMGGFIVLVVLVLPRGLFGLFEYLPRFRGRKRGDDD
jgi:branched-chain amino acid transport system permease protein